jgi:hypothetical protein
MRRIASALSALTLLPAALWAQSARSPIRSGFLGGIHVGTPAIVSLAVGGYRNVSRNPATEYTQDVFALLEPGVNAGRVSVGYGDSYGTFGTGWTIRATLLRTWRRENANYAGAEGSAMVLGFGTRLGIFRRVDRGRATLRVTADLYFGL